MPTPLEGFIGIVCVCGEAKQSRHSFCRTCYRSLPKNLRDGLWQRFGEGYEEVYFEAVQWLKERKAPTLPFGGSR